MYEISIKTHFSAAHHLRGYQGTCEAHHGHNWNVEVFIRGIGLDETGLLLDFRDLKEAVRTALTGLDHVDLNTLDDFAELNPTSENIARYLYGRLVPELNDERIRVAQVCVEETPGTRACYREDAPGT